MHNHIPSKVWDEITCPSPNFNGSTVEVSEWISNSIPHPYKIRDSKLVIAVAADVVTPNGAKPSTGTDYKVKHNCWTFLRLFQISAKFWASDSVLLNRPCDLSKSCNTEIVYLLIWCCRMELFWTLLHMGHIDLDLIMAGWAIKMRTL